MKALGSECANRKKFNSSEIVIISLFFIGLFIFFSIIAPNFLSFRNLSSVVNNLVVLGILSIAVTPLLIARGLDISFGASLSLSTIVMATMFQNDVNIVLILIVGILIPLFVGLINGLFIEIFNLNPLIFTLGMASILIAVSNVIARGFTISMLVPFLFYFSTNSIFYIPYASFILVLVLLFYWFLLTYTKLGKKIFIIGSNPTNARLMGFKVKQIKVLLYVLTGFVTGIASIIIIANTGTGYSGHGNHLLIPVLAAIFIGGMTLEGGEGNIWKVLLGVLVISVIFNGLSLMNVPSWAIRVVRALLLLMVVMLYQLKRLKRVE